MLRIRIVATATLVATVLGAAIAGAAAQNAPQPAGRPLPLLQFVHQKGKPKLAAHRKIAAKFERKPVAKRHIARRPAAAPAQVVAAAAQPAAPAVADTAPANTWPAATPAAPAMTGTVATPPSNLAVQTETVVQTDPNDIVSGGHAAQVTSPDQVDADALAADNHEQAANEPAPSTAAPAATAIVARAAVDKPASPVGSASWIAQVLAALGGAITAGVVAWFLIRPAPIRIYG